MTAHSSSELTPAGVLDGSRVTGGAAIIDALLANGVDTLFGLPGAQMYPLFDALQRRSDRIATVGARHEQACGYMAFGYARSTSRPGVFSVVPGPGVLNTAAALCTAWGCNAPVLCITGQVPSQFLGRRRGHLHELSDQLGTLRSLVKWAARIERAADAPEIINEAFRQMLSGRPGPVAVEMAWDQPVVSITGDGGFMFGVQELATAAQYGIGLVTVLFNNDAYGNVLRDQQVGFGGRRIGSELRNPDFRALAAAFGVTHHRVGSPAALKPVLAQCVEAGQPALIEVTIDRREEVSPWEFIIPKHAE